MRIHIWVHKNDIIKGKITEYYNICPQGSHWPNYIEVSISVDEFTKLNVRI